MELTDFQKIAVRNLKMVGIEIDFLDEQHLRITQKKLYNGFVLTKNELVDRAKKIFPDYIVKPVRYSLDVSVIDVIYIKSKIKEIGLNVNDLAAQTAIDKSSLSLFLSGERKMNKSVKALFFYYFLTYELNKNFRSEN
jgi:hypothetical protein